MNTLVGKYIKQRKILDYTWHKFYPPPRQIWQDTIIDKVLASCPPGSLPATRRPPHLVLAAGAMGSGKTHTFKKLQDVFGDLRCFVTVDVDRIKENFPEMKDLIKRNPHAAGDAVHREACTIHEIVFRQALENKQNVFLDGSLRNGSFFERLLAEEDVAKGYTISILHVKASIKKCTERALWRAKQTGRFISPELIEKSHREAQVSVDNLCKLVDHVVVVDNEYDDHELSD